MSFTPPTSSSQPEYVWELATLYPSQGNWTEAEYLDLTDHSNRRIEFIDGRLEFLPMPTEIHQELIAYLYHALYSFVKKRDLGKVHFSGLRVRIRPGNVREPDVLFLHKDHYQVRHNRVWDGADLAMEVVSEDPKDRQRDYEQKLVDYAEAGIAEYWIVDYLKRVVVVHRLDGKQYQVAGEYKPSERADSKLLDGFSVDVGELFASVEDIPE